MRHVRVPNSKRAIRRAVELGDAWYPFLTFGAVPATARTASMDGDADLIEGIRYMNSYCETSGRERPPEVILASMSSPGQGWNAEALVEKIGQLQELGVCGTAADIDGRTRAEWCDNAERYATEVIAKIRASQRMS